MSRTKTLVITTAVAAVIGLGALALPAQAGGPCGGGPGHGRGGSNMMGGGPGGPGGPGGMLQTMDADGDGIVTRAEFDSFHVLAFRAMDPDGTGAVTLDDFLASRQGVGPGAQQNGRSACRADRREQMQTQRFNAWDANGDGSVTQSEFQAASVERFAGLDLDNNAEITKQEVSAAMMYGGPARMMGAPMAPPAK
ncbi:EF-hand domain-containing protein [Roseospira visakhapatnamensis]|uniref:EF-hand domain-containing protein n=1 Tax=Roseospira visakhapatnamensis TaxID=390880 RepID=A0A7W6RAB1_9PROT|nr:hypothetical protein [Roseospira visakhapatnamensis]MBB4264735.1 hypothetical protein [Roseospira visakhapatnamensis]